MSLPIKTDALEVVSGGAANPKITAGTADPTGGLAAPEGSLYVRYVASNGRAYLKSGPGDTDWSQLSISSGGTLDGAYDFGGPGAGRIITADSGAVQIDATTNNTQPALQINRQPGSSAAAVGISVTLNSNVTGPGITVAMAGTGPAIQISSGALEIANSSPGLSPSNTGRIKYDSATQKFQASMNGAAYVDLATGAGMAIGTAITGATAGSVLFAGVGGVLQQDNANLFWNDTTNRLGVGTTGPGYPFDVEAVLGNTHAKFGAAFPIYLISANPNIGMNAYFSSGWKFGKGSSGSRAATMSFDPATGLWDVEISNATGAADAAVTMVSRLSVTATGVVTVPGIAATDTFFITTGNQNVANGQIFVGRNHATDGQVFVQGTNPSNTNPSAFGWLNQAGTFKGYVGFFPSAYAFTHFRLKNGIFCQGGEDLVIGDSTNSTMAVNHTSRFVGIGAGVTSPLYSLSVRGSTTASRIHFSNSTTDTGGYLVSAQDSQAAMAGGMAYNGTQFIAKAAQVAAFDIVLGEYLWYNNIGQTIGAAATAPIRMKLYSAGGLELSNSDSATVSIASAGKIRYNTTGQKLQMSFNTAAYFDMASYAAALTAGSVVFANGSNQLAQDNTKFFWDNTNKWLGIGTSAPAVPIDIRYPASPATDGIQIYNTAGGGADGRSTILFRSDVSGVQQYSIGIDPIGGTNKYWAIRDITGGAQRFFLFPSGNINIGPTGTDPGVKLRVEGTATVTNLNWTTGTTGSVWFTAAGGALTQDNANFFWDDTNNRLGLGVAAPANMLHVKSATASVSAMRLEHTQTTGGASIDFYDSGAALVGSFGYANSASSLTHISSKLFLLSFGAPLVLANTTRNEITFSYVSANTNVEMANGGSAAVSTANTGRIRYNTTGQTFQASANGAAYQDVVTRATEYLSADGAADPEISTTFVSGTGTDLTLANGTKGGFVKTFVITGGSGTITPTNLADGDVLTWTASPANVSFIWDATNTTWHVVGNPYNMVTT